MTTVTLPVAGEWPAAVVFDLDGTIADTAPSIQAALNAALATAGLRPLDLAMVRAMIGAGPEKLVQRALAALNVDFRPKSTRHITHEFHVAYERQGNLMSTLFNGAESCLAELSLLGVRMAICSNKPERFIGDLLADLGIRDYFAAIQGSGSGLPHKPDPAPLLEALAKLGAGRDDALYVGDSRIDVQTARAAGIPVAVVKHGYTMTPARELGADWVVESLADLTAIAPLRR